MSSIRRALLSRNRGLRARVLGLAAVLPLGGVFGGLFVGCSADGTDVERPAGGAAGSPGSGGSGTGGVVGSGGSFATGGFAGGGSGGVGAGGVGGGGAIGGSGGGVGGGGSTFPPVTDFAAPGPFDTTTAPGGSSCTVSRPDPLGEEGRKHPIIIWGNGTGATPSVYQAAHTHWASHGFIVAAANTSNAGDGTDMIACLDYVIEQNGVSGSPYFDKVDAGHVGASGHSQGGGGTLMAGRDARVTVTAPLQPYILLGLGGFQTSSITQQNGPMFLMSGSGDTIARPSSNQQPVFDDTNVSVFWGTLQGATHTGTAIGSIGGYRGPATAWFRLHLMGDENARALFYGASCGLCSDSSWVVERKGIQ
jgi:hypothetical protein